MFEKFSNLDIASAGSGGEYTVQVRDCITINERFDLTRLPGWLRMDKRCPSLGGEQLWRGTGRTAMSRLVDEPSRDRLVF